MKRKVLFVCYGGGHIAMILPVLRSLRETHPHVECVLLALTNGFGRAVAAGEKPLGYKDFLHLTDQEAALAWGARLEGDNHSPDVSRAESRAYLGINYLELEALHGPAGAAALYAQKGRYAFCPVGFMRRLLGELQPAAVVATNSPRSEEAALRAAAEMNIPTVGLVDLFGMDSDPFVTRATQPDWTCVIAESVRQRLLRRGFSPPAVVVTGNPAFDGLFSPQTREAANRFLAARGWQELQVILYIGAWEAVGHPATDVAPGRSFPMEIEKLLRTYVHERPGTALIVRYHPGDWFEYPRLPDEDRVYFSEPPREPIHPLILAAAVVVNTNSTVGLEAAVAGKPVVSIENSPSVHQWFSLAKLGVSYPSATHHELAQTLDDVLATGEPLKAFFSDGQAAPRVAQVIAQAAQADDAQSDL